MRAPDINDTLLQNGTAPNILYNNNSVTIPTPDESNVGVYIVKACSRVITASECSSFRLTIEEVPVIVVAPPPPNEIVKKDPNTDIVVNN